MTDKTDKTTELDQLFAQARAEAPRLEDGLLARIMADAEAVAGAAEADVAGPVARPGWGRRLLDGLGGWPAMSGMVTATFVGLAVGVSPPALLSDLASGILNGTSDPYLVDPYEGFGFDLSEG